MFRKVLLSSAALALVATAANAHPNVMLSPDKRFAAVMPGKNQIQLPPSMMDRKKTAWLFSTFATNPEAVYYCCYGRNVNGPSNSNFGGAAFGIAEQFIPKKSASVTTLAAAVGYTSGDKSVILTLYADNGSNSPGTALASATGTSSTVFGNCCGVVTVSIPSTSLTANTPYWVGITATGNSWETATYQDADQVDNATYVSGTSNGGTSWSAGFQQTTQNPAIGV